jgi:hypothetical protein
MNANGRDKNIRALSEEELDQVAGGFDFKPPEGELTPEKLEELQRQVSDYANNQDVKNDLVDQLKKLNDRTG